MCLAMTNTLAYYLRRMYTLKMEGAYLKTMEKIYPHFLVGSTVFNWKENFIFVRKGLAYLKVSIFTQKSIRTGV
jgi:hypothetical protein